MSNKHFLELSDFDKIEVWTVDEDADDGSLIPLEIRYFESGELDAGNIFVKGEVKLADKSSYEVILGLKQIEEYKSGLIIYKFEVFCIEFKRKGGLVFNIYMGLSDKNEILELIKYLGKAANKIFPIKIEHEIKSLNIKISEKINCEI